MDSQDMLQYAIVGDLLMGWDATNDTRYFLKTYGFKPEYITVPELRSPCQALYEAETKDPTLLSQLAQKTTSSETLAKALNYATEIPTDIEEHARFVCDNGRNKALWDEVDRLKNMPGATAPYKAAKIVEIGTAFQKAFMATAKSEGISIAEIKDPLPEEEDPNCLFRNGYLLKGGANVLVSVSGVGKSVISMQLAYAWALGRAIFDIEPLRPLKIGIFQTEDDERDMAMFRASMREGYKRFHGWTDDDIAQAEANILTYPMRGKIGTEFLDYLARMQCIDHCDLVIINPLTGVTNIDISNNQEMSDYLRKQMDGVIKHTAETKCGLLIVHHTNKPPAANQRAGFGTDQYAQYVGAGAGALTNWMRAMLAIMPDGKTPGQYFLVAAKRGDRLHAWPTIAEGKPLPKPRKIIRHATPDEHVMFWIEVKEGASTNLPTKAPEKPYSLEEDVQKVVDYLRREALPLTEARKKAKELCGNSKSRGENAYNEIVNNLSKYDLVIKSIGDHNKSLIGSRESIENPVFQHQKS